MVITKWYRKMLNRYWELGSHLLYMILGFCLCYFGFLLALFAAHYFK